VSARVAGRLRVVNEGTIVIGERVNINSTWLPTEFVAGHAGRIEIGNGVLINFGTVIAAAHSVSIGDGCMIGANCIISDVDIPEAATATEPLFSAKPIFIGKEVWLAGRVTIRPGVTIGDGAVVVAGSIVESDIPPQTMASGIPARPLPKFAPVRPEAERAPSLANESVRSVIRSGSSAAGKEQLRLSGVVISDFTMDELVHELAADSRISVEAIGYPPSTFLQNQHAARQPVTRDFAVVWTSPAAAVPLFGRLQDGTMANEEDLTLEVDKFCAYVEQIAAKFRRVLVPTWIQPSYVCGQGTFDSRPGGSAWALTAMNLRLMSSLGRRAKVLVLDAGCWQVAAGRSAFNPRAWYLGHMGATRTLIIEAARDFRVALDTLFAPARMLLALAWETAFWDLRVDTARGSAQAISEAYGDFQRVLHMLRGRGVLIDVLGQSESSRLPRTIHAFTGHVLKEEEINVYSAAEGDEVNAITALASRLGVSLDAVVYVNAQSAGRDRMRAALPAVFVPDWPTDRLLYPSALLGLRCFDGLVALDSRGEATR
jgi:acetyltransferase-like isoleucine patch superfamily enzyme